MSPEERELLINQVSAVIKRQNSSEIYPYFNDFLTDCANYGLDEYAFNTQILPEAYTRIPKVVNSGNYVVIFGERCYTTEQMGLVFFNYPAKSEIYMEDKTLFKKDLREIEDSDTTLALIQLFNSEKLIDRRYLKVIYHLNANLPYRIETFQAENIYALLKRGFEDSSFYKLILKDFLEGYLHIWLEQTDTINFAKIKNHNNYHDFLKFIYAVDSKSAFFVGVHHFDTPAELILYSQQDGAFRRLLYKSLLAGNPQVWFNETGNEEWSRSYEPLAANIARLENFSPDEKLALTVQALQQVVAPGLPLPYLTVHEKNIDFIDIEGARPAMRIFTITARNIGYARAAISLKNTSGDIALMPDSIRLDTSMIDFDSFENCNTASVILSVNPVYFIKDKLYSFEISITTLYQTISIPVSVSVIFPKNEYLMYLVKYAGFGALFFVLIRAIDKLITDSQDYYPSLRTFSGIYNNFEDFYWKYLFVFIIMVCGIVLGYKLTKKVEKQ